MRDDTVERVRQCLEAHGVGGQRLVVAVSGGPDSVCLLHLLAQLREPLGLRLHAAHLDHGLHPQGQAHARYVAGLCRRLGVPASIEARDVAGYRRGHRLSVEAAAREVRYSFLAQVAQGAGAGWIATGHTADDQVETLLLRLLRGTGWVGLQGMAEAGPGPYAAGAGLRLLRPLLSTTRAQTESYCRVHHLRPRQDPTNLQPSLLRNRVRRHLLPLLEGYNPRLRQALLRLAGMARDQVALLDAQVTALWSTLAAEDAGGLRLSSPSLLQQPKALRHHLLRRALERLAGGFTDFEAHHLERLGAALAAPAGRRLPLPHGLWATTEHRSLYLARHPAVPLPPLEGEHVLRVPGETFFCGWKVTARLAPSGHGLGRPEAQLGPPKGWEVAVGLTPTPQLTAGPEIASSRQKAEMRYEAGVPLWVRPRRPGDRFHPLGMAGTKKLQDFMVDAHIPREWRDRVPLVCSPQGILWVVGWRVAEPARVTPDAGVVLALEFERMEAGG